jgi:hypothetical protein
VADKYVYKTFYTVNSAKEYLADADNNELRLFAADHINKQGTLVKAYVISTYAGIYALSNKFSTSFYEWIDGTVPVKLHLDIDCKEEQFLMVEPKQKLWIIISNKLLLMLMNSSYPLLK